MEEEPVKGKVGDYTVTFSPILGHGAFGSVHEAIHNTTNKKYAAKQIFLPNGREEREYMCRLAERELEIVRNIPDHENIVRFHGHILKPRACWIFLEFCDRGNLHEYLAKNTNLDLMAKVKLFRQTSSPIAFMHSQDPPIIHRDIKLENIMMTRKGNEDVVKITDFGLSKICDEQKSLSKAFHQGQFMTTTCGSQYFMAPEFFAEFRGGVKYDASVDTFALGLVHLVILESGPGVRLVPLSVEATKLKQDVSIGQEMIAHHRDSHPFPTVVEIKSDDSLAIKRVKRIIINMAKFKPLERKSIAEVEQEMREIEEQILLDAQNKQEVDFFKSHLRKEKIKNSEQEQIIDTLMQNKDAINRDDVSTSKKEIKPRLLSRTSENPQPDGATAQLCSWSFDDPKPKAYKLPRINILVWKADITQLHVDVIVNAANEDLEHDGGLVGDIAKAAGPELTKESKMYIKNYGRLRTANVCSTTAGRMPAKKVFHTVGPIWNNYENKFEALSWLYKAFRHCIERANRKAYKSIALPAISAGLFGAQNEEVASSVSNAILEFCKRHPDSSINYIHLVDISPDCVGAFQQELDDLVGQGDLQSNEEYADFQKWLGPASPK